MPQRRQPKRGGANSKMKKYPRIIDYLQQHHKPVYEIIDSAAMHGSLSPRRGGGITFLIPDKKLIAKINKILESDEPEVATDIISSLIVTDFLGTTQDFKNKQSHIPTLIGRKLVVKSVSAKDVELEGGGKLTVDAKFQPFDRSGNAKRGNMAVWNLSGEVDYEKAPEIDRSFRSESVSGSGHKSRSFRGGAQQGSLDEKIKEICQKESDLIKQRRVGEVRESAMLNAVVNKLKEWEAIRDTDCRYNCAMEVISGHPIPAFYLIFCNRDIFSESDLGEIDANNRYGTNVDLLQNMLNKHYEENSSKFEELQNLRSEFRMSKFAPKNFEKIYKELESTNKLVYNKKVYVDGYYHKELFEKFKKHPGLKCMIDQFNMQAARFTEESNRMQSSPMDQCKLFCDFVRDVNISYGYFTKITPCWFTKLDEFIDNKTAVRLYEEFLQEYAFCRPGMVTRDAKYRYTGMGEDDDDESDSGEQPDLKEEFSNKPVELSEECIAQLQSYLDTHDGKLPAELGGYVKEVQPESSD